MKYTNPELIDGALAQLRPTLGPGMVVFKTAELIGPLLDAAVALAEGRTIVPAPENFKGTWVKSVDTGKAMPFMPNLSWNQAGPIIERERISVWQDVHWHEGAVGTERWLAAAYLEAEEGTEWSDHTRDAPRITGEHCMSGPTYLVAAMRCYVASKLGEEIDLHKKPATS